MVQPVVPQKEKGAYCQAGCVEPAGGYKIRMEPGCIHIWSGQKELTLLYSALTELEETGTLIIFFCPEGILGNTQTRIWG